MPNRKTRPQAAATARGHNNDAHLENNNCDSDRQGKLPAPQPLPDELLPVEPFDFDLLPETMAPWAEDICNRMQCAPDYVAVTIMTLLGVIVGRKVGVRPKALDNWTEVPNQWALLVGRPGTLKSPAMEEVLTPLKRLEAEADRTYRKQMEAHTKDIEVEKILSYRWKKRPGAPIPKTK